ncbi:MAG: hypothetical protein AB8G77_16120 [Rhodothermales bacterium]
MFFQTGGDDWASNLAEKMYQRVEEQIGRLLFVFNLSLAGHNNQTESFKNYCTPHGKRAKKLAAFQIRRLDHKGVTLF